MIAYIRKITKKIYNCLPVRFPFLARFDRFYRSIYSGKVVIVERYGSKMELHLDQSIDSAIFFNGCFEPNTVNAILKLLKPGNIAFDIGANVGCHCMLMANVVGSYGKVFAFEPTDWGFKKLKRNYELNSYNNLVIERLALSDEKKIFSNYEFRSQWLVSAKLTSKEKGQVDFITLDEYVKNISLDNIDFIKIDVDGYEYKIICGGQRVIQKFKPILIIEMGDTWLRSVGDTIEKLHSLLAPFYSFYRDQDYSLIPDVVEAVKRLPGDQTINVICIPNAV